MRITICKADGRPATRYGPVEKNSESAVNILIDVVKAQQQVKMDDWSPRYPTNVQDVARVLLDIGQHCQCLDAFLVQFD